MDYLSSPSTPSLLISNSVFSQILESRIAFWKKMDLVIFFFLPSSVSKFIESWFYILRCDSDAVRFLAVLYSLCILKMADFFYW